MVAGALMGLLALLGLLLGGHLDAHWALALLIGPPIIALMSRFPLVLDRASAGIEVGFESAVLVFLACYDGGDGALAVWTVGQIMSQIVTSKRVDVRVFNVGLSILAGAVALMTMRAFSPLD